MIVAAYACVLDDAVAHIGASMGTVQVHEPKGPTAVLVEHEVFAQKSDLLHGRLIELAGRGDRLPVAAHELAHGGTCRGLVQPLVLVRSQHVPLPDPGWMSRLYLMVGGTLCKIV